MALLTRLPGSTAAVSLYATPVGSATWDNATWGGSQWATRTWIAITCEVRSAEWQDGADRALGVLSQAAGGSWTLDLYDPDRVLDPSNPGAPFRDAVTPGNPMRLEHAGGIIGVGIIDSLAYDVGETMARLRGVDQVARLSNLTATYPSPAPTALRDLARKLLTAAGVTTVTVEPDPAGGDNLIGQPEPLPTAEVQLWSSIADAAADAFQYAWIDRDWIIRFTPHADPLDRGLTLGCDGIPALSFNIASSADGIRNRGQTRDSAGALVAVQSVAESIRRFGTQNLDRTNRRTPNATTWLGAVLADRAYAAVEYLPSEVWPTSSAELEAIAGAVGIELVRTRLDVPDPDVEIDGRYLGKRIRVSPDGWAAEVLTYVSNNDYAGGTVPEPEPPDPPPLTTVITRSITSTKAARIAKTSGGANYGAGADTELPVGYYSGWTQRALIEWVIDWSSVVSVVSAKVRLRTTTQINIAFGSTPKVKIQRLTGSWSEGSLTTPGSGNSVVYPGPTATSSGEKVATVTRTEDAQVDIDITAIARAWAPASAGGGGVANRGIRISGYTETSTAYATEFRSDDYSTASKRPILILELEVPA